MTARRRLLVSLGVVLLPAIAALAAPATGRVKWQVTPPKDSRLSVLAPIFENRRLPVLTAAVGQLLLLPRDLRVVVDQCGAVDSFHDAERHRVVLCYELAGFFGLMFERKTNVDPSREQPRFSDEHSLSPQRFYNVLCLAYGADPGTVAPVAERLPAQGTSGALRQRVPEEAEGLGNHDRALHEPSPGEVGTC